MNKDCALDLFEREIKEDAFVLYYNHLYRVVDANPDRRGKVRILLFEKSDSTKPLWKYAHDMCIIEPEAITVWLLTRGWKG